MIKACAIFLVIAIGIATIETRVINSRESVELKSKYLDALDYNDLSSLDGKMIKNSGYEKKIESPLIHVQKKRFFNGFMPKIHFYVKHGSNGEIYFVPIDENLNHYFIG